MKMVAGERGLYRVVAALSIPEWVAVHREKLAWLIAVAHDAAANMIETAVAHRKMVAAVTSIKARSIVRPKNLRSGLTIPRAAIEVFRGQWKMILLSFQ